MPARIMCSMLGWLPWTYHIPRPRFIAPQNWIKIIDILNSTCGIWHPNIRHLNIRHPNTRFNLNTWKFIYSGNGVALPYKYPDTGYKFMAYLCNFGPVFDWKIVFKYLFITNICLYNVIVSVIHRLLLYFW